MIIIIQLYKLYKLSLYFTSCKVKDKFQFQKLTLFSRFSKEKGLFYDWVGWYHFGIQELQPVDQKPLRGADQFTSKMRNDIL